MDFGLLNLVMDFVLSRPHFGYQPFKPRHHLDPSRHHFGFWLFRPPHIFWLLKVSFWISVVQASPLSRPFEASFWISVIQASTYISAPRGFILDITCPGITMYLSPSWPNEFQLRGTSNTLAPPGLLILAPCNLISAKLNDLKRFELQKW